MRVKKSEYAMAKMALWHICFELKMTENQQMQKEVLLEHPNLTKSRNF